MDHLGERYYSKKYPSVSKVELAEAYDNGDLSLDELKVLQYTAYKALTGGGIEEQQKKEGTQSTLLIKGAVTTVVGDKIKVNTKDEKGISIQSSINHLVKEQKITSQGLDKVGIRKIINYGLMKPEGGAIDKAAKESSLQEKSYSFIHLTFQEYLAGQYLFERMKGGNAEERAKVAQYIAEQRTEPRFLMMLKFMAGIVTSEGQDIDETESPNAKAEAQKLVNIFWDAVTCNVDGVLELGSETKIGLLMHLLSQAKVNGQLDQRIPNLKEMEQMIDILVLSDLSKWGNQLKESDYMSENIKSAIIETMKTGDASKSIEKVKEIIEGASTELKESAKAVVTSEVQTEFQTANDETKIRVTEIFNNLISRFTEQELKDSFTFFKETITNNANWKLTKSALGGMTKIVQQMKLISTQTEGLTEIFSQLIEDANLVKQTVDCLVNINKSTGSGELTKSVFEKIIELKGKMGAAYAIGL